MEINGREYDAFFLKMLHRKKFFLKKTLII